METTLMVIQIKVVFGQERSYEVTTGTTILELKAMVAEKCKIPMENQKMLLNGRALLDTKTVGEYNIHEGTKINVFVTQSSSSLGESLSGTIEPSPSLHTLLYNKLRLYFSDEDALKVADEFMRDFYVKMGALSLDDIERLATQYLEEDSANAAAAAGEPHE